LLRSLSRSGRDEDAEVLLAPVQLNLLRGLSPDVINHERRAGERGNFTYGPQDCSSMARIP